MSLSLITLALTLRNILQNCGWPIHQIVHNHNTTTACNIHICSVLPPPIFLMNRGNVPTYTSCVRMERFAKLSMSP